MHGLVVTVSVSDVAGKKKNGKYRTENFFEIFLKKLEGLSLQEEFIKK